MGHMPHFHRGISLSDKRGQLFLDQLFRLLAQSFCIPL
jgi:hypothetical protein